MKIAIASLGDNENSEISDVAGRSPFFIIFNGGKLEEIFKNPFRFGGGGSGTSIAKVLSDKKVDEVIAGKFGENVKVFFEEKGIKLLEKKGKVRDVIRWIH